MPYHEETAEFRLKWVWRCGRVGVMQKVLRESPGERWELFRSVSGNPHLDRNVRNIYSCIIFILYVSLVISSSGADFDLVHLDDLLFGRWLYFRLTSRLGRGRGRRFAMMLSRLLSLLSQVSQVFGLFLVRD